MSIAFVSVAGASERNGCKLFPRFSAKQKCDERVRTRRIHVEPFGQCFCPKCKQILKHMLLCRTVGVRM